MDRKKSYRVHFLALSLLFVLGNACITAPDKNANEFNFLGFMVAGVIAIGLYFATWYIPINRITLLPIWLLSFYCISDSFITFLGFISENLLPDLSRIIIALPFAILLIYIGFQKMDTLLKFSLICGVFVVGIILLFFVSTLKDFNLKNIYIYKLPSVGAFWDQILPYIKSIVLPIILLALFTKMERVEKSTAVIGIVIGIICFGLCILNTVLLFGIQFSGRLDYPYSSAGSTVTFGYLFTRLDGFLYFLYLVTSIVKCAVGILVIKKSREKLP